MINLNILSDNSEIVPYNYTDFPIHARLDLLSNYMDYTAPVHWHNDLEFIVITEGEMYYTVNGIDILLKKGDGIFINSRQLHGHYSVDNKECKFLCVIIPTSFYSVSNMIQKKYINRFCYSSNYPFILLKNASPHQNTIIKEVKSIYKICKDEKIGFEIDTVSHAFKILNHLICNVNFEKKLYTPIDPWVESLHKMIGFVQTNYSKKISLEDIAQAGNVCRSKCFDIFRELMHQTPNDYLISYRINKSMELLKTTSHSVTEIALMCGFGGSSYFTKTFKAFNKQTPKEYRSK